MILAGGFISRKRISHKKSSGLNFLVLFVVLFSTIAVNFIVIKPEIALAAPTCASIGWSAAYTKTGNIVNLSTTISHLNGNGSAITLNGVNDGVWAGQTDQYTFIAYENGDLYEKSGNQTLALKCTVPASTFVVAPGTNGTNSLGTPVTTPPTPIPNSSASASTSGTSTSSSGDTCGGTPGKLIGLLGMVIPPLATVTTVPIAMCQATMLMVNFLQYSIDALGQGIQFMLDMPARMIAPGSGGASSALGVAWGVMLRVTLGLLTLALLLIAFANILNVDEKLGYGLNRMIPRIILSIIMAMFSYLIARVLLDLASAFQASLFNSAQLIGKSVSPTALTKVASDPTTTDQLKNVVNSIPVALLMLILLLMLLLGTLWLLIILTIRTAMVWILVALAPVAMLMNILPFTESYYKMWWKEWWKWLFMGPAIAAMLFITSLLLESFKASFNGGSTLLSYMLLIMAAVCLFLAGTIPLSLGGKIMSSVTGAFKKGAGIAGQKTGVSDFLAQRKASNAARPKLRAAKLHAGIAATGGEKGIKGWAARQIAGVSPDQVKGAKNKVVNDRMKEIEEMGLDKKSAQDSYMKAPDGVERTSYARFLSSKGWHRDDDQQYLNRLAEDMDDPLVAAHTSKEQSEVYSSLVTAGKTASPNGSVNFGAESGKATSKALSKLEDLTHQQVTALSRTTEGQQQLVALLENKQKVNALSEKGRERTVAALGEFMKTHPVRTVDADHGTALATITNISNTYTSRIDPKTGTGQDPWHKIT